MIKQHYGFLRLVLLGSAGYQRAELPLDDAVSLIAPNNTGKTSLINALQFLLIINKQRMDFGAHDFDKTKRFYFPNNSAYILLEAILPDAGTVVLGCVGKGIAHDYEYFAYQGVLNVDDYRLPNGNLVTQPQLTQHLASLGKLVFSYSSTDFAEMLYGGRHKRNAHEPDFTLYKLEHRGDAAAFQRVLTRTLKLDKLSALEVKNHLLRIFKRDLPDANINFKEEWDKAFSEVNLARAQYQATQKATASIDALENIQQQRLILRGKLIDHRPRVDAALSTWQDYYHQNKQQLTDEQVLLVQQQTQQLHDDRERVKQQMLLVQQQQQLRAQTEQQSKFAQRLALFHGRTQIEEQLQYSQQALEQQIALLSQVSARDVDSIVREQQRNEKTIKQHQQALKNQGRHLYQKLANHLSDNDLEQLNKVLNAQVMTLAEDAFSLDIAQLTASLSASKETQHILNGLSIHTQGLTSDYHELTSAQHQNQLDDLHKQQQALGAQLKVAQDFEQAQARKTGLETALNETKSLLADYDLWQSLIASQAERETDLQQIEQTLQDIEERLSQAEVLSAQLRQRLSDTEVALSKLNRQHQDIDRMRNQRGDDDPSFTYLIDLPHHVWLAETDWNLNDLADKLRNYQRDCHQLLDFNQQTRQLLNDIHHHGLTKYHFIGNEEQEVERIIAFRHQLPQEKEAIEKQARSAVVNVTASLRELRDGLHAFKSRMREFNRLISHRQLSDLKVFKIEPEDEPHLVNAINVLISTAEKVDSGESFNLFDHSSLLDDQQIDAAKRCLIDEGNARLGLRVSDLFRLQFIVAKQDGKSEAFDDMDGAASNGTVLMAKLVTGLAMLYLMQDKRYPVQTICYLDEALALDASNQKSLIDTAKEFGFALIFASPAPIASARYCVPIVHANGFNHISQHHWQILEPIEAFVL